MKTDLLVDPELLALAARIRPDRTPREVLAHIVWGVITEPGDAVGGVLRAELGAAAAVHDALSDAAPAGLSARTLHSARGRWRPRAEPRYVGAAAQAALRAGIRLLLPGDAEWPLALGDLGEHEPALLWVRGDTSILTRTTPAVSIVGARASTPYGDHIAREIAGDLALSGHAVVSGGAYGIDGATHRSVLGVGGDTVAFLAGGVDRAYPAGHTQLISDIAARGLVISEVPCGSTPTKWRFLARNRLIGALGAATVVVEAGWRSGTLNTAGHAASLGRPLGAVPGPVTSATSAGCHRLLREYDARCVTSADEVRELLGVPVGAGAAPVAQEHERTRLGDALSTRTPRTPQELAQRSGLSVSEVESLLGVLSLEGAVVRTEDGWRQSA